MAESEREKPNDIQHQLRTKIDYCRDLLKDCDAKLCEVSGFTRYRNLLKNEMEFLEQLERRSLTEESTLNPRNISPQVESSNLSHYAAVLDAASQRYPDVVAVMRLFSLDDNSGGDNQTDSKKLRVDLVTNGGKQWVKVVARKPRGVYLDFVGANCSSSGASGSRSLEDQAGDFVEFSQHFPFLFRPPRVVFDFVANGVPDCVAHCLENRGLIVKGKRISAVELGAPPDDDSSGDEDEQNVNDQNSSVDLQSLSTNVSDDQWYTTVNLDVSSVFVLVSDLTNGSLPDESGGGAFFHFKEKGLDEQAELERRKPAKPFLDAAIKGKRLLICRTALTAVNAILNTVGGPMERKRAKQLLDTVQVVDDKMSDRAKSLLNSDAIAERPKIIFGCGDYYRAVTVSASKHFLQAAAQQGVTFAAIIHESRALTEQKRLASAASMTPQEISEISAKTSEVIQDIVE